MLERFPLLVPPAWSSAKNSSSVFPFFCRGCFAFFAWAASPGPRLCLGPGEAAHPFLAVQKMGLGRGEA